MWNFIRSFIIQREVKKLCIKSNLFLQMSFKLKGIIRFSWTDINFFIFKFTIGSVVYWSLNSNLKFIIKKTFSIDLLFK